MERWNSVYAELQDDSEYLFVAIESGDFGKDDVDRAIKTDTGNLLGDMLPSGGDDVLGRLRVVFKSHGEVVDAWGHMIFNLEMNTGGAAAGYPKR